jgi:hypothetical protein
MQWAFQPGPQRDDPSAPAKQARPVRSDEPGAILCAACRTAVSHESARIEVNGAHGHRFTNPAGFTYDIVCLSEAACYVQGPPTNEFSWFAGYAWSYAMCGACHTHLGWYYEGPMKFFGLISDRLL